MRLGHGLKLADVRVICSDSVVATLAQLTHHRSAVVRSELRVCSKICTRNTVYAYIS